MSWRCFSIVIFVLTISGHCFAQASQPLAIDGIMNMRQWNLEQDGNIELKGNWEFYWNQFIAPSAGAVEGVNYFHVPGLWNDTKIDSMELQAEGFASYRLFITGSKKGSQLAIEMPDVYCSYELFLNGQSIAHNGKPATTKEASIPQWHPLFKEFTVNTDTVELVLHISNYRHHKGGISNPIKLGMAGNIKNGWGARKQAVIILVLVLFSVFVFYSLIFLFYNNNRSTLYYSLFSLSWALRTLFSGDLYLAIDYFPNLDWIIAVRIEYLTLFFTLAFGILFIHKMFNRDVDVIIIKIMMVVNAAFALVTLATPPDIFSYLVVPFHIFASISIVYIAIVITAALLNNHMSAWFVAVSMFMVIFMFVYNVLSFQKLVPYNPLVLSIGFIAGFALSAVGLMFRFSEREREMELNRSFLDFDPKDLPKEYTWYNRKD